MPDVTIVPYLYFSGRCDEAIEFYGHALDAKLQFIMRFNESPDPVPAGMLQPGFENKVMHATLGIGGATMMISDGCNDQSRFSGFSVSIAFSTEAEVDRAAAALAEGGTVTMPPTRTFWSPRFGMLTDRFGVAWMVTMTSPTTP